MKTSCLYTALIISLLFFSANINAQCAGISKEIDVCDIANASSKSIDLYAELGPTATSGGKWEDLDLVALSNPFKTVFNTTTGVLNAQLIPSSGTYQFKYTVTGCAQSAIITVNIGGYSGTPAPTATVCSVDGPYNLFQVFNGAAIAPQFNGVWYDEDNSGALVDEFFIPTSAPQVETPYTFTYRIPAVGNCPAPPPATIVITVARAPYPGIPVDLAVCSAELDNYTNLNLFDQLTNEDPGGIWKETNTGQLTSVRDSEINLKNIYENFGEGTYRFSYTVKSPNRVCPDQTSTISICIDSKIDFSQASLSLTPASICEKDLVSSIYKATLNQNQPAGSYGADGDYEIEYNIVSDTKITPVKQIIHFYRSSTSPFVSGVTTFDIDPTYFDKVGSYTVNINSITRVYLPQGIYHGVMHDGNDLNICYEIKKVNLSLCSTAINVTAASKINATPTITSLTINPICNNTDAEVFLSGTNLIDGDSYKINYTLSGINNQVVTNFQITIVGGASTFYIPKALIPKAGVTKIVIDNITNLTSSCSNDVMFAKDFEIKPVIDIAGMTVSIVPVCLGSSVNVVIKGLSNFTQISLDYNVSGANVIANQTTVFAVVNGQISINFPNTSLTATGLNTFEINKFVNLVTGCELILSNKTDFMINDIPLTPMVTAVNYCKDENKTIADLVPNGSNFKWYDSLTSLVILANNTLLTSAEYYVSETNASGCISDRAVLSVTINDSEAPVLLDARDGLFCGLDNPTLKDLDDAVDKTALGTANLIWFDSLSSSTILSLSTPLEDKKKYYAYSYASTTMCYSSKALEVEVSLYDCDAATYGFFIPDGFSPNGDNVNDSFNIPNIDLIYPNFTLEIYNRYGSLMFKGNKNKPSWNGENSDSSAVGGIAPNGVYFYVINFNKDNIQPKQGRLYLNR